MKKVRSRSRIGHAIALELPVWRLGGWSFSGCRTQGLSLEHCLVKQPRCNPDGAWGIAAAHASLPCNFDACGISFCRTWFQGTNAIWCLQAVDCVNTHTHTHAHFMELGEGMLLVKHDSMTMWPCGVPKPSRTWCGSHYHAARHQPKLFPPCQCQLIFRSGVA